jgi:hypothetical protein
MLHTLHVRATSFHVLYRGHDHPNDLLWLGHHPTTEDGQQWWHDPWLHAFKFLQERHMERIVDTSSRRQQQSVGQTAHPPKHFIRPIVFRRQLGLDTISHRRCRALVQAQPDQVGHRKLEWPMQLVMRRLHKCLCLEEAVSDLSEEGVAVAQLLINCGDAARPCLEQDHGWRRTAVDHLKGRRAERRLIRRAVAVLCPRKPMEPSPGSVADKAVEVDSDDAVGSL